MTREIRSRRTSDWLAVLAAAIVLVAVGRFAQADDPISDLPQSTDHENYQTGQRYEGVQQSYEADDDADAYRDDTQRRAALGVDVEQTGRRGVEVTSVHDGGAAERAGLQEGDLILSINGQQVSSHEGLADHVQRHEPGDTVRLTIRREGQNRNLNVRLAAERDLREVGERIGRTIGQIAERVGSAVEGIRGERTARVRDRYDRYYEEPSGTNDDLRYDADSRDMRNRRYADRYDDQSWEDRRFARRSDARDEDRYSRDRLRQRGYRGGSDLNYADDDYDRSDSRFTSRARRGDYWTDEDRTRNRQAGMWDRSQEQARGSRAALGVMLRDSEEGVTISGLYPGGPADEAGLLTGDRLVRIDGRPVNTPARRRASAGQPERPDAPHRRDARREQPGAARSGRAPGRSCSRSRAHFSTARAARDQRAGPARLARGSRCVARRKPRCPRRGPQPGGIARRRRSI